MYLGNLSFDLVQKYLVQVEKLGLVEVKDGPGGERVYYLTRKGEEFLVDFKELQRHAEIVDDKKQVLENVLDFQVKG
jgi:predicted transcriptional regulator